MFIISFCMQHFFLFYFLLFITQCNFATVFTLLLRFRNLPQGFLFFQFDLFASFPTAALVAFLAAGALQTGAFENRK